MDISFILGYGFAMLIFVALIAASIYAIVWFVKQTIKLLRNK